jgi:ABC-2 type transport system ATP-binding protein
MHPAVEVINLRRIFYKRKRKQKRAVVALDDVNLKIKQGELFGILGPNGAGKTTLIKILVTLLLPSSGKAFVDGIDVVKNPQAIRRKINMVCGGEHSGYGILTVWETLWMFSQFYGISGGVARGRIEEILRIVGLADEAHTKINRLSSGMRQKMNFARGFINDPKIVFLDEPTIGLDVGAAKDVRNYIKQWVKEGKDKTVLLTTHYMLEAEELCDRVAIIDRGRILACDTPANLKRILRRESIFHLEVERVDGIDDLKVEGIKHITSSQQDDHTKLKLILERESAISQVIEKITAKGSQIFYLRKTEPSLEDVFIDLVGRGLEVDTTR